MEAVVEENARVTTMEYSPPLGARNPDVFVWGESNKTWNTHQSLDTVGEQCTGGQRLDASEGPAHARVHALQPKVILGGCTSTTMQRVNGWGMGGGGSLNPAEHHRSTATAREVTALGSRVK